MKLGAFLRTAGHHVAAWRHPRSTVDSDVNFARYVEVAKIAERGLFDMLFWADVQSVPDYKADTLSRAAYIMRPDPFTLLAALAAITERIGLVCTASSTYNDPYHIARNFTTLDHVSGGRSGWNLVTSGSPAEALNFSYEMHPTPAERYDRAREFAEVVLGLWDSFDRDAFVRDAQSGRLFDPEKMHVLDHKGKYFQVRGPLNVARSSQGRPIMVQAGSSEDGKALASEYADVIFTAHPILEAAQAFYADVKARVSAFNRDPDQVKIMPGVFFSIGRTEDEARQKYQELQDLIDPVVGLMLLEERIDFDLTGYPLDGPLPELPARVLAQSRPALFAAMARRNNMTIRQLYQSMAGGRGHVEVIGTPVQIADILEEWFRNGAADGFNVMPPILPGDLNDFVNLVVPELQRRGLFRTSYEGRTLRENLGLRMPTSRYEKKSVTDPKGTV
jgi:FMN-dependent oxidoreductase (nitrilotriacetate monooxygenase family)